MRAGVERLARRWWGGELGARGRALSIALVPAAAVWRAVTVTRNGWYDRVGGVRVDGLDVISVGNLVVGGTGKTPIASWVARACRAAGRRPAILTNAYGRDEALLHRSWTPDIPVRADRDRVAAARAARGAGADVAVLDDGFQHRRLERHLDVVLVAVEDRFPGRTMPLGPYREGPGALSRADAIVLTRRLVAPAVADALAARLEREHGAPVVASAHLAAGCWTRLDGSPASAPVGDVLALAGVARPDAFGRSVAARVSGAVELVPLGDHHELSAGALSAIRAHAAGRPLVVTEKDAVKLTGLSDDPGLAYVLRQEIVWDWGEEALVQRLARALGSPSA